MFISVPHTCFEPVVSLVLAHWFISFSLSWIPVLLSAFCFCGFQLCFTQARLQLFDPPVFLSTLRSSAFTKSMLPSCLSSTKKVCHVLEHPASNSPAFSHRVGWIPSPHQGTAKSARTRLQEEQQENPLACPASGNLWHDWQIFECFCWLSCFSPWHVGAKKCGISTCMLQCATHPHYPIMEAMGAQNGDQRRQSQIHWREGLQHDERMVGNPLHGPGSLMSSQRVQCSTSAPLLGEDIQCHHHLLWKRMNMEVRITGTDWEWQCQPHIRIFIPFIKQLMSFCIWIISINTPGMWRFPFLLRGWGFSSSLDMVPRVWHQTTACCFTSVHSCASWGNLSTHIETEFYWKGSETSHFAEDVTLNIIKISIWDGS